MEFSVKIGILAGVVHLVAYLIYNKKIFSGKVEPNTGSWILWGLFTALNTSSYMVMSADWVKGFLTVVNSALCVITVILSFFLGKFKRLDKWDIVAVAIGTVGAIIWASLKYGFAFSSTDAATYANLILQAAIVVSFFPICRGVWSDPKTEKSLPWALWTLGYTLNGITVVLRWNDHWQDLVYPTNCFFLHSSVAVLVWTGRYRERSQSSVELVRE